MNVKRSPYWLLLISFFIALTTLFISPSFAASSVQTTRDAQGVWHITGNKNVSAYLVFKEMGYNIATDRLFQIDVYRRQGTGTMSELFGPSEINSDIFLRNLMYSKQELKDGFKTLDPESKLIIRGYVAGINKRIKEVNKDPANLLPAEYALIGIKPEPFTIEDTLAWSILLIRNFDVEAFATGQLDNAVLFQTLIALYPNDFFTMFNDLRWINDPDAQTVLEAFDIALNNFLDPVTLFGKTSLASTFSTSDIKLHEGIKAHEVRVSQYRDDMKKRGAYVKMGSYAWAVAGDKTTSGLPMLYAGPQMGFPVPSIVAEGSIQAGGYNVSGLTVPGLPGFSVGRTPHVAWASQVGHAHTVDYHLEDPNDVYLHRFETIKVAGGNDVIVPIYRGFHGPIVEPLPYNPQAPIIVSWKNANAVNDFKIFNVAPNLAKAKNVDELTEVFKDYALSQHITMVDSEGNIGYLMTGVDPIRPVGLDPRLPQVGPGWADINNRVPYSQNKNTIRGYYGGWNNKTNPDYDNSMNNISYSYGPAHRAHVIYDYFESKFANPNDKITYQEFCDLAINIAATVSFGGGGNTWSFVADAFSNAVMNNNPTQDQLDALAMLNAWDGHFVAGGPGQWVGGTLVADAWILQDAWIRRVLELTFDDELPTGDDTTRLFNVLLHGLNDVPTAIVNQYDWFANLSDPQAPQTAEDIIVTALNDVLADIGLGPYNAPRGDIVYQHPIFGPIWSTPFGLRSTYAQCVEMGPQGPTKIGSFFPLGPSGDIRLKPNNTLEFSPYYFSMTPFFDSFTLRQFPLFEQ